MLEIDCDWNKWRFQVEIKTISSPFILFTFEVMSIKCEIKSHPFAQQKNENAFIWRIKKEIIWLYLSDWMTSNTLVLSLLSRNLHQMTIFHLENGEFHRNRRRTCCYHTDDLSCMDRICVYETRKCQITFSPKSTLKRCLECYYTGMTVSFGIIKFSAYKVNNDGLATIKSRYRIQFDIPSTTFESKHTLIRETRRA